MVFCIILLYSNEYKNIVLVYKKFYKVISSKDYTTKTVIFPSEMLDDIAWWGQDYTRYLLFVVIYILLLTIIYMFFFKTELRRKNAGKILIKSQPDGAFPEGRGFFRANF